jgi:hypothetical protein
MKFTADVSKITAQIKVLFATTVGTDENHKVGGRLAGSNPAARFRYFMAWAERPERVAMMPLPRISLKS